MPKAGDDGGSVVVNQRSRKSVAVIDAALGPGRSVHLPTSPIVARLAALAIGDTSPVVMGEELRTTSPLQQPSLSANSVKLSAVTS